MKLARSDTALVLLAVELRDVLFPTDRHIARLRESPEPGYNAYNQALVRQGCAQFATLHNSTSAEQRANAARVLKGYEDDLRVLSAQR